MSLYLVTAPTLEPVTAADQRDHSRIDINDDDTVVEGFISAARQWCENYLSRQFINATWRMKLDTFAGSAEDIQSGYSCCGLDQIEIPRPPLQSVSSITYYDSSNTQQTLSTSVYEVDTDSTPGIVRLKPLQTWPTTYYKRQAVTINFVAGYGGASATDAQSFAAVPQAIKNAIKLLAGFYYENREGNLTDGQLSTVKSLLDTAAWGVYA